jgi:hypothetical protein
MPPFHSRSTGARSIAVMSSAGVSAPTDAGSASRAATCGVIGTDLALRGYTPPPGDSVAVS